MTIQLSVQHCRIPADDMVTTTSRRLSGSTATYTCNSGFELLDITPGSDMRTCQPDGTWSGSEAQCIGILIKLTKYDKYASTSL